MFDPHLIAIAAQSLLFLAGVYAVVLKAGWTAKDVNTKVDAMSLELRELKQIVIVQAVQARDIEHVKGEVLMLQRTVEDMRRGAGWIGARRIVDGEYSE